MNDKKMEVEIRPEREKDRPEINKVNILAFGKADEAALVEKLRKNPDFLPNLSLVAVCQNQIVGHVLFFPVTIGDGQVFEPSLALAPISVLPEKQKQGIGGKLIETGLKTAKEEGYNSVIVVGDHDYYLKFGFEPASRWDIRPSFDVLDENFMALELKEGALDKVSGRVRYPEEFGI